MKLRKTVSIVALLGALVLLPVLSQSGSFIASAQVFHRLPPRVVPPRDCDPKPMPEPRSIDLVICLDTSGSMTQLIDSARARLWDVVNELSSIQPTPKLRVGLLTYGTPGAAGREQGFVVLRSHLTDDLDAVYSTMMNLTTRGGEEYVGWVLNDAVHRMAWSTEPNALHMIFVAGNESADQCRHMYDFRHVTRLARQRGITINAIYAGSDVNGRSEYWDQVGNCGGGTYAAIDMEKGVEQVATPYDKVLIELNAELNATYVPYGAQGAANQVRQVAQDDQAAGLGVESAATRVEVKAKSIYKNAQWDLVDAVEQEGLDVAKVPAEQLPPPMQKMTITERKKHVESMRVQRGAVQRRIRDISEERQRFIQTKRADSKDGRTGLGEAIIQALRQQLEAHGISVEQEIGTQTEEQGGQSETQGSQTEKQSEKESGAKVSAQPASRTASPTKQAP
jgi:hypothetical protein